MRIGMIMIAAVLLGTSAHAQPKQFDAAEFASTKLQINAKGALSAADWKKYDAALAKCSSSESGPALIDCMNRVLKSASAPFTVQKKGA